MTINEDHALDMDQTGHETMTYNNETERNEEETDKIDDIKRDTDAIDYKNGSEMDWNITSQTNDIVKSPNSDIEGH